MNEYNGIIIKEYDKEIKINLRYYDCKMRKFRLTRIYLYIKCVINSCNVMTRMTSCCTIFKTTLTTQNFFSRFVAPDKTLVFAINHEITVLAISCCEHLKT